jgi:MtN3 and saliva related transmembrane protein
MKGNHRYRLIPEAALSNLDILGLVATCFTTSSFFPQVITTWRTRDVSGISLPTYLIITIGLALWLVYGLLRGDLPLIVANAVMVVLTASITVMKILFSKR